ncbi:MAG: hypothetical protein HUU37_03415 [Bdellovibrionales bacterium]|nr:hypothetical protein [Bdellovibrionales bacterium]
MHLSYAYNKEIAHSLLSRAGRIFDDGPVYAGGYVGHAVTRFNKYGGCLESEMPSDTSRLNAFDILSSISEWRRRAAHWRIATTLENQCRDADAYFQANTGVRELFPGLSAEGFTFLILQNKARHLADCFTVWRRRGAGSRRRSGRQVRFPWGLSFLA